MCHNIIFPSFIGEQPRPTYYLSPANIYGLVINDASKNTCSVFTQNKFEGRKGLNNISSYLLHCINEKGYYSQSYGKNHKMTEITSLVDNYGGKNKNNVIIHCLNMIIEGVLFGTAIFHIYIKGHTNNDFDCSFNSLKVLYQKQHVFTFEK